MNLPLTAPVTAPSTAPLKTETADQDVADQARPGQGVPSQDPDSAAQFALEPEEAESLLCRTGRKYFNHWFGGGCCGDGHGEN